MAYIGITDMYSIAVEYDEFADDRLQASLDEAEVEISNLVRKLAGKAEAA